MASIDDLLSSSASTAGSVVFTSTRQYTEAASSGSTLFLGYTQTLASSAVALPLAIIDSYAMFSSGGSATSSATPSIEIVKIDVSRSAASSALIATFNQIVSSSAAAVAAVAFTNEAKTLSSAANILSSVVSAATSASSTLVSSASASTSLIFGLLESVVCASAATSTATAVRAASVSLTSATSAASQITFASAANAVSLLSSASGASAASPSTTANSGFVSRASGRSYAFFRDPNQTAYVINTETEALSMYKNFAFNSITYADGVAYAACHDGFYELRGQDDDGTDIDAQLVTGFFDMDDRHKKHAGSVYLGYTCDGPMTVSTDTYGAGHAVQTNDLDIETLDALAPRNNRVKLGKGLNSRYWRLTIRNKNGSRFELNDVAIDVAVSKRRI